MKNGACEQVLKDAQQLADNRAARRIGQRLGKAGRIVRPLGIMLDSINVAQAFREDEKPLRPCHQQFDR